MRLLMVSLATLGVTALPAAAEQDVPEMPAPSIAETDRAEPDWFRKFNFTNEEFNTPVWENTPSQTFNLAWIQGDRWRLSLDLTSREAEIRITPRLSVGGELTIGAEELNETAAWEDQEIEAGIRLRSAFKF